MTEVATALPTDPSSDDQPLVFISYHRSDRRLVLRLKAALAELGVAARGDWDLEAAVKYEDVLGEWIEEAGMFVLIMTPESLASSECGKEIDRALQLGKKLAAVLLRPVALESVPPNFRAINWVMLQDDADLARAASLLLEALDKDRDWENAHTILLRRAMDWKRSGQRRSAVLRREDLREAEQWLARSSTDPTRVPRPAEVQFEFVRFSRSAERRLKRTMAGLAFGVLAVTVVLLWISWRASKREAVSAEREAASNRIAALKAEQAAASDKVAKAETEKALASKNRELEARKIAEKESAEAVRQRTVAETNAQNAARETIRGIEERGRQLLVAGDPEGALPLLSQVLTERQSIPGLGDDAGLRFMLAQAIAPLDGRVATYWPHGGRVLKVALRPDGKQVMTLTQNGALRLWDAATGSSKSILAETGVIDAFYSPDGTRVVTLNKYLGETDGESEAPTEMSSSLINAANGATLETYELDQASDASGFPRPQFSRDGKVFFLGKEYSETTSYSVLDGTELTGVDPPPPIETAKMRSPCNPPNGASVGNTEDGTTFVTDNGQVLLSAECRWLGSLEGPLPLQQAVFRPDGSLILAAQRDAAILWRRSRPRASLLMAAYNSGADPVFADPASTRLLVAHRDSIDFLDTKTGQNLGGLALGEGQIVEDLIPLTTRAVVQIVEGPLEIWDVAERRRLAELKLEGEDISINRSEGIEPQWITAAGAPFLLVKYPGQWDVNWSTIFEVWNLITGNRVGQFKALGKGFDVFAFSRDGRQIFGSASSGNNPSSWVSVREDWSPDYLADSVTPLHAATFSRDDTQVIAAGEDRSIRVWDIESGKIVKKIAGRLENVDQLSLSNRGRYLLASSLQQCEIIDLQRGVSVALIEGTASGDDWAFSPDERFAVTAGPDAAVRVYEVETGRLLWLKRLPALPSSPARWDPSGAAILIQAGDSTMLLNTRLEDRTSAEVAALAQTHLDRRALQADPQRRKLAEKKGPVAGPPRRLDDHHSPALPGGRGRPGM